MEMMGNFEEAKPLYEESLRLRKVNQLVWLLSVTLLYALKNELYAIQYSSYRTLLTFMLIVCLTRQLVYSEVSLKSAESMQTLGIVLSSMGHLREAENMFKT